MISDHFSNGLSYKESNRMEELILINSADSEVSRRLARMLTETSYLPCILDNLDDFFELNSTIKSELIIIECQPDCFKDNDRINLIKKLTTVDHLKLIVISSVEQMAKINQIIDNNQIRLLIKPILYTNFVKEGNAK